MEAAPGPASIQQHYAPAPSPFLVSGSSLIYNPLLQLSPNNLRLHKAFQSVVKGTDASPRSPWPCWDSGSLSLLLLFLNTEFGLFSRASWHPELTISLKTAHQAPLISYSLWYDGYSVLIPHQYILSHGEKCFGQKFHLTGWYPQHPEGQHQHLQVPPTHLSYVQGPLMPLAALVWKYKTVSFPSSLSVPSARQRTDGRQAEALRYTLKGLCEGGNELAVLEKSCPQRHI